LRPFGDDRLENEPDGRVSLVAAASKEWRPAVPAASRRAEHPGTAVSWEGAIFEVLAAEPLADGGVRYSLAPWRDDHAIRLLERYDAESETARRRERRWKADALRKRRAAILLSPLLGHLPGSVQERMEREFGAPANAMTIVSALPLLAVGQIGLMGAVAGLAGVSLAPLPEPPFPLAVYLFGESAIRLVIVATQSRPAGSLAGTLAFALWTSIIGKRAPAGGAPSGS